MEFDPLNISIFLFYYHYSLANALVVFEMSSRRLTVEELILSMLLIEGVALTQQ